MLFNAHGQGKRKDSKSPSYAARTTTQRSAFWDCPSYFHLSPFSILYTCCPSFAGQLSVSCICSLSNPFLQRLSIPPSCSSLHVVWLLCFVPVSSIGSLQMLTKTLLKNVTFGPYSTCFRGLEECVCVCTHCSCYCLFHLRKEIKM